MGDAVIAVLIRDRIKIITFTSQIFQMLDMVLFRALKKHATGLSTLDEEQQPPHS
jgi:hypothetical protein